MSKPMSFRCDANVVPKRSQNHKLRKGLTDKKTILKIILKIQKNA